MRDESPNVAQASPALPPGKTRTQPYRAVFVGYTCLGIYIHAKLVQTLYHLHTLPLVSEGWNYPRLCSASGISGYPTTLLNISSRGKLVFLHLEMKSSRFTRFPGG